MVDRIITLHSDLIEELELLKLEKKDATIKTRQREKTFKQLDKLKKADGLTLSYEIDKSVLTEFQEVEQIEKRIKFTKSMIRRIESVFSMYDMVIRKCEDEEEA
ncbi:MAG: hypothetical protein ACRCX2_33375 [Paraclostridium sp.]